MKKYLFFDSAKCSACGACALACIERQRAGMLPACVKVCPTGALVLLTEDEFKARQAGE